MLFLGARPQDTPLGIEKFVETHAVGIGVNSELFWLPFKVFVIVEELVSEQDAPLRYASLRSRGKNKYLQMLLVLG